MAIPSALAGADQVDIYGSLPRLTTLSGSASPGPILEWEWTMLSVPSTSTANVGVNGNFTNGVSSLQNPQFVCDAPGSYVLQLRARNSIGWSDPDVDVADAQTIVVVKTQKLSLYIPGAYEFNYDTYLNDTLGLLETDAYSCLRLDGTRQMTGSLAFAGGTTRSISVGGSISSNGTPLTVTAGSAYGPGNYNGAHLTLRPGAPSDFGSWGDVYIADTGGRVLVGGLTASYLVGTNPAGFLTSVDPTSIGVTDHGALTGLGDDDHAQYALLAGRPSGQRLIGGTAATDYLKLQSTSAAGSTDYISLCVGNNGGTEAVKIGNSGVVGIGMGATAPVTTYLEMPGSTTNSVAKFGVLEVQSYSAANAWIADNTYFNGSNFKYRTNSYVSMLYFLNGGLMFKTSPSGTAGNNVSPASHFTITNIGSFGIGGNLGDSLELTNSWLSGINSKIGIGTGNTEPGHTLDVWCDLNGDEGIRVWNKSAGGSSLSTIYQVVGAAGTSGGSYFGTASAITVYGIVNGLTLNAVGDSQDIGFRTGAAQHGGTATGPTMIVSSTCQVGVRTASTGATLDVHTGTSSGANSGIRLTLDGESGAATSYVPIDFYVPTSGLTGQFLATANNYYSSGIALPADSIGLLAEHADGALVLGACGASGYFSVLTGGYSTGYQRMLVQSGGGVLIGDLASPWGELGPGVILVGHSGANAYIYTAKDASHYAFFGWESDYCAFGVAGGHNLLWLENGNFTGIGNFSHDPTAVLAPLHINKPDVQTAQTRGLIVDNLTASLVGTQVQRSPMFSLRGSAWDLDNTVSRTYEFGQQVVPVAGNTVAGTLVWSSSLNGAAYSDIMTLSGTGTLTITKTTALSAAALDVNCGAGGAYARVDGWLYVDRLAGDITHYFGFKIRGAAEAGAFGNCVGNGQGEMFVYGLPGVVIGTYDAGDVVLATSGSERFRVASNGLLSHTVAGGTTSNADFLSLINTSNAASMTDTRTSIRWEQFYYDVSTPAVAESARIVVGTEGNWTSTASTQDAYMAFQTARDGVMTEAARFSSLGNLEMNSGSLYLKYRGITRYYNSADTNWGYIWCPNTDAYADLALVSSGGEAMRILGSNMYVGIGTTTPTDYLTVTGATTTVYRGQLSLYDSTAQTTGVGGQITFGGKYTNAGDYTEWAGIQAQKVNATTGQFGAKLVFRTRGNTGAPTDRVTILETGFTGVNTAAPGSMFTVRGESATHKLVQFNRAASDTAAWYMGNDSSHNGLLATNATDLLVGFDYGGTWTETMRVTAGSSAGVRGRLGVGCTPAAVLDVKGYSTDDVQQWHDASGNLLASCDDTGWFLFRGDDANMAFRMYPRTGSNKNRILDFYCNPDTANSAEFFLGLAPTTNWAHTTLAGSFILSGKTGSGTSQPIYISAGDDFNTGTPTMTVATTKRVGIGTTAPQSLLDVQGPAGSGTATAGILTLATLETTIVAADELGRINFNAPLEASGTDAILPGASIWAVAEAEFTASVNSTTLIFATGTSAAATEKMRITSAGRVGINCTPDAELHVTGPAGIIATHLTSANDSKGLYVETSSSDSGIQVNRYSGDGSCLYLYQAGGAGYGLQFASASTGDAINVGKSTTTGMLANLDMTGVANSYITGVAIRNSTAALVGSQIQRSPMFYMSGSAWDTDGAVSKGVAFATQVVPTPGDTTGVYLGWYSFLEGGSFNERMKLSDLGLLTLTPASATTALQVTGAYAAHAIQVTSGGDIYTGAYLNIAASSSGWQPNGIQVDLSSAGHGVLVQHTNTGTGFESYHSVSATGTAFLAYRAPLVASGISNSPPIQLTGQTYESMTAHNVDYRIYVEPVEDDLERHYLDIDHRLNSGSWEQTLRIGYKTSFSAYNGQIELGDRDWGIFPKDTASVNGGGRDLFLSAGTGNGIGAGGWTTIAGGWGGATGSGGALELQGGGAGGGAGIDGVINIGSDYTSAIYIDATVSGIVTINPTGGGTGLLLSSDIPAASGAEVLVNSSALQFTSRMHGADDVPHYSDWQMRAYSITTGAGISALVFETSVDGGASSPAVQLIFAPGSEGDFFLGDAASAGPTPWKILPMDKTGSDIAGDSLTIRAGKGSGTGTGGTASLDAGNSGSGTKGDLNLGTIYAVHVNVGRSGGELGFYGAAAVAQQSLAADPTAAEISTVLHNLGLVS